MPRKDGFTLIELIVVLALFSILFSIAAPKLGMLNRYKENEELKICKRDLFFARNQAIVNGKIHYFKLDYSKNSYFIMADGKEIKRVYFNSGLSLVHNPNISEFTFGRSGAPLESGTINLKTSYNKIFKLSVTPVTGKISLTD